MAAIIGAVNTATQNLPSPQQRLPSLCPALAERHTARRNQAQPDAHQPQRPTTAVDSGAFSGKMQA